jgi:hypothetical protein
MAVIVPGREQNETDAGEAVYDRGGGKLSWTLGGPKRAPSDGPPGVKTIWAGLTTLNTLLAYRLWLT